MRHLFVCYLKTLARWKYCILDVVHIEIPIFYTDINECSSSGANNCHLHADCHNTEGLFHCTCQNGYSGDGSSICNGMSLLPLGAHAAITQIKIILIGRGKNVFTPQEFIPSISITGSILVTVYILTQLFISVKIVIILVI